MNMTIFLVCTIFCSIQKLIKDENNIMKTNKHKFINEKNITFEDNLINIYNEYPNEELIIKKQKHIENNNFYEDNNHLKSHNYLSCNMYFSNDILNNMYEVSKNKTIIDNELLVQNKDMESEKIFFEDVFNVELLLNNNNLCNKEDFIDYCNLFSLELLDNTNTDKNTEIDLISKDKQGDMNFLYNLDKINKINDNIDTNYTLKISPDDI
ncbi:hypothetical protein NAPIS_ORF00098 [Vairimorpha apis BRL 01]|uniref:Uncharacterized protein n=1 Tax=Vairimorpha apis BRL 01 TaxID=1037528 RepID=T0MGT8_9MICR|nr:hypothetical protein NAPIS_ORF00098 [Vairimorpha apis BRL 01]